MINQQLVDYIKIQLSKNIDRETIIKELSDTGWTELDVQENFAAANIGINNSVVETTTPIISTISELPKSSSHFTVKLKYIILFFLLISTGASAYHFRSDIPLIKDLIKSKDSVLMTEINNAVVPEVKIENPASNTDRGGSIASTTQTQQADSTTAVENNNTSTSLSQRSSINCGSDMKCFISAAKNCTPSFVEQNTVLNIFGMYEQTNRVKFTLVGYDSSKKCKYINKVLNAAVDYAQEVKSSPEYKAATEAQKKEGLSDAHESMQDSIGMTTTCSFTTIYLSSLLEKWEAGKYSSFDLPQSDCSTINPNESDSSSAVINTSSNEFDIVLNKKIIFSNKEISASDLSFTLLEVNEDLNDKDGWDKILKISVSNILTGENKIITYYKNYNDVQNVNHQDKVFGILIKAIGYNLIPEDKMTVHLKILKL